MKRKHTVLIILGVVAATLAIAVFSHYFIRNRQHAQWLERSVSEIQALSAPTNWMADAFAQLPSEPDYDLGRHFISPDVIWMANGEWIIYRSATHKQGTAFPELFIGRASDEQWYYTTYHFCHRMIVLGADGQPPSLESFRTSYRLVPYTRQPYKKLKKTWPAET